MNSPENLLFKGVVVFSGYSYTLECARKLLSLLIMIEREMQICSFRYRSVIMGLNELKPVSTTFIGSLQHILLRIIAFAFNSKCRCPEPELSRVSQSASVSTRNF